MKKSILLSISVVLVLVIVISEIVHGQGKSDRGPLGKIVFIHYKKPRGRPENPGKSKKPPKDGTEEGSYTYIANGCKWKTTEGFIVNTIDAPGGIAVTISDAMDTWEVAADASIFGGVSTTTEFRVNLDEIDYRNVIEFSPLDDNRIIAVTYVWGYWTGPPGLRQIVEVDMIFNTDDWLTWGTVVDPDDELYDVLNIATHEIGHAAGMGDLYNSTDNEETMYGYSSEGETKKIDLYYGDIAGIQNLYK